MPYTPQHRRRGHKPKVNTPQQKKFEAWLLGSPSRRHIAFRHIKSMTPELGFTQDIGDKAIHTAFKLVGYGRQIAKRKGFSDNPKVMAERLSFAEEGITWTVERLYNQICSDKVWAHGGAHT